MALQQTAYVILGLLSIKPHLSGYDMRKAIQNSVGYFWNESYGQIYPTLKRLASEGLIKRGSSPARGRKKRHVYVLTQAGRVRLRQWLALPFRNDPPRNEFLLKLFFGREAEPGVCRAHLRDLQERNRRALATLQEIKTSAQPGNPPNPHFPYWMLTLSMGEELTRAALEWSEEALKELSALESAGDTTRQSDISRTKEKGADSRKRLYGEAGSARSQARGTK